MGMAGIVLSRSYSFSQGIFLALCAVAGAGLERGLDGVVTVPILGGTLTLREVGLCCDISQYNST